MRLLDQLAECVSTRLDRLGDILPRNALAEAELARTHQARQIHVERGYNAGGSAASNFGMRNVQTTKRPLVILDRGKPVLKVVPYVENMDDELSKFRGLLLKYDDPTAPVGISDWRLVE